MASAGPEGDANGQSMAMERAGSNDEVTFFSSWVCPFAQRAWIALEEKKVAYRHVEVDLQNKSAEFLAVNPRGLVPAIVHKGKNLYESMILVEYVDEAFPRGSVGVDGDTRGSLMPLEPYDRAVARTWLDFINKNIPRTFLRIIQTQDAEGQEEAKKDYKNYLKQLTAAMTEISPNGPFFMGEEFGMVDIALIVFVIRHFALKHYRQFTLAESSEFERFHKWVAATMSLPSVKATLQDEAKLIQVLEKYANNTAVSQAAIALRKNLPLP